MRFAVVGAGAIGAYVGAALARGGSEVTLIARGAHLKAMQEHGVQVLSPRGDFHVHPPATDDFGAVADADIAFIGLKAYSLPELAPRLGEALTGGTAVIPAQNGIPWWYFQSHPGPLANTMLESVDPGVIRHVEGTRFAIGEPDGSQSERCRLISEAFIAGGLKCPVEHRLRDQIWLKLIGNVAFNPVTALTRATLGQLGELPEMVELLRAIFQECAAVAAALEIELPVSLERRLEAGVAVGDHKTSMLQD